MSVGHADPAPPLVCLIAPGHVASTPRLVKEADALLEAGYRVHVVCGRHLPLVDPLDAAILVTAKWPHTLIDATRGLRLRWHKLRRRLARAALARGVSPTLARAIRAHHAAIPSLARAAVCQPADIFIGHCLAGLAAAAIAAEQTGAALGFDAEDFHGAETDAAEHDPVERAVVSTLERVFIPRCVHLTAASPEIGAAYRSTYGLARAPITVLNVFPLRQAPPVGSAPPVSGLLRLYWFSQTIGPGRGLESLLAILAAMRHPVSLHLRGLPAAGFPAHFLSRARQAGFPGPIEFLPSGLPDEMVRLAAPYDLGLSLEERTPHNRDLCLTNKIFTYLLAGIPQLLSATSAQRALAPALGNSALLADFGRPVEMARELDAFFADSERVAAARRTADQLARRRFCWEVEQQGFLTSLRRALA